MRAYVVALHLIVVHTIDGYEVLINPEQVTSIRAAKENEDNKFLANDVHCVIGLTDGKFVSTAENCEEVEQKLEEAK